MLCIEPLDLLASVGADMPRLALKRRRRCVDGDDTDGTVEQCMPVAPAGIVLVHQPAWDGRCPATDVLSKLLGADWATAHAGVRLSPYVSTYSPQVDLTEHVTGVPAFLSRTPWNVLLGMLHAASTQAAASCDVSSRALTKCLNGAVAASGLRRLTARDVVPRIAHAAFAFIRSEGDSFVLALPGYFTLLLDRRKFPTQYDARSFFAYELLGCTRDVVKPHWRFAECQMTVPGSLCLIRQVLDRLPSLVDVPWFAQQA